MHTVHLPGVDLNLLVAFDALLAERSVTRAARRIGITQPAMSHALARLRSLFDDELLVRTPRGMLPTPRAEALEGPIRGALAAIERAIGATATFEPAEARRSFTIGTSDYGELVTLPPLLSRLSRDAPGIDLRMRPMDEDWPRALEAGELDLAIGPPISTVPASIKAQRLFDERFVCVLRAGHPAAKRPLTLARYVALPHALIAPRGRAGGYVDDALAARGLSRRIALVIPHFLVAPFAVANSDLVVTLAERVARAFAGVLPLSIVAPPLELPGFSFHQFWHERVDRDPAHRWLRACVHEVSRAPRRGRA